MNTIELENNINKNKRIKREIEFEIKQLVDNMGNYINDRDFYELLLNKCLAKYKQLEQVDKAIREETIDLDIANFKKMKNIY